MMFHATHLAATTKSASELPSEDPPQPRFCSRDDAAKPARATSNSSSSHKPTIYSIAPTMPHHGTPTPSLNLQIPSLHDALLLPARVYLPAVYTHPTTPPTPWSRKVAVVAHPYAPLGGCYDDLVVLRVVSVLVKLGWVVGTFNFRGAGGCKGKTSWTGKAEVHDYMSVVAWVLAYVQSLPPPPASSVTEKTVAVEEGVREESIALLLAGYSYGSLITSRLPSTEKHILPLLTYPGQEKTAFTTALDAARQSARRWWDTHSSTRTSYSGSPVSRAEVLKTVLENNNSASPTTDTRHSWEDSDRKWEVTSSYLLISPPLPPISSCLLGFGSGSWGPSAAGWAKGLLGHHDKHGTMDGAADGDEGFGIEDGAEVLAVYGDGDTFTAVKKYRKWREKMMVSGRWKGVEVEGAGHFWHEDGVGEELERTVKRWTKERDV